MDDQHLTNAYLMLDRRVANAFHPDFLGLACEIIRRKLR
jgi:hypothetical protein